ncbi:MAG: hypothetical protein NTU43_08720 [Bacteroidetes bacterium]|nr:hypothetical protein [Bacteroidota bacterium]
MQAFALFRLPHEDKIYFIKGQISLDLEVLDFGTLQSCFVISPFAQKNRAFIIMPDEMNEWQGESFDLFYHQDSQESGTESQYIHYVNHAIETLTTHLDIHKFVSARVKNLSKPDTFNVFDLFRNLSQNYPSHLQVLYQTTTPIVGPRKKLQSKNG